MAWLALPFIKRTGLFSIDLPNSWNYGFSYYVTCILVMLTYIPGEFRCNDRPRHMLTSDTLQHGCDCQVSCAASFGRKAMVFGAG
jgi:hypothetical protein